MATSVEHGDGLRFDELPIRPIHRKLVALVGMGLCYLAIWWGEACPRRAKTVHLARWLGAGKLGRRCTYPPVGSCPHAAVR